MKRFLFLFLCTSLYADSRRPCDPSSGPYVTGSFLYWQASVEDLNPVAESFLGGEHTRLEFKKMPFRWQPGFKVGAGFQLRDDWDL